MRKLMKLIAITAMTALLLFVLATCASADEKIYTSPVFRLPRERLEDAEKVFEAQEAEEAAELEEAEEPGEEPREDESLEDEAPEGEEPDEDEDFEELGEDAGEVTEPAKPKHEVIIRSSQGEIVTEGDVITLTSELRGFGDDEQVEYQWQVDRGNGDGWEDVAGANKDKFVFVADRESIRYSWRLIVTIVGEDE